MENNNQEISSFKTIKNKHSIIFQLWRKVKVRVEKVIMITLMLAVSLQQQSYATSRLNVKSTQMITVYSFSYDQNGNLMAVYQDDTLVSGYQYNDLNQLEHFSDEKKSKTYLYHYYSNGQRSQKEDVSTGNVIHFYYGQKGKLLNEALTLIGEETKRSSYFAGNRFIRNISNQNDSTLQTPLAIRKNNPLSIDLSAGVSTKESVHLDNYGLQSDENSQVNQSLPSGDKHPRMGAYEEGDFNFDRNPFVYGAGYYDSESGLNFQRARYYNPATQSFMAQDSKDLVNRYNYANSNPVMNYDPSGHNALKAIRDYTVGSTKGQWVGSAVTIAADIAITAASGGAAVPLIYGVAIGASLGAGGAIITAGIDDHWQHWQQGVSQVATMAVVGGIVGGISNSQLTQDEKFGASHTWLKTDQYDNNANKVMARAREIIKTLQSIKTSNGKYIDLYNEGMLLKPTLMSLQAKTSSSVQGDLKRMIDDLSSEVFETGYVHRVARQKDIIGRPIDDQNVSGHLLSSTSYSEVRAMAEEDVNYLLSEANTNPAFLSKLKAGEYYGSRSKVKVFQSEYVQGVDDINYYGELYTQYRDYLRRSNSYAQYFNNPIAV